jgi:hypothetical protein
VAFPALGAPKDFLPLGDGFRVVGRQVGRQRDQLAGGDRVEFGIIKLEGEGLDIGDDLPALFFTEPALDQVAVEGLHAGAR